MIPELKLEIATGDQKVARDRLTHREWGKLLTIEQYLERERALRDRPWARAGMTTWLLRDSRGQVLSSCETFQMNSRVNRDGLSRTGNTYGVASVFTEPALRGSGHAARMIGLLNERIPANDPDAQAIILYSEIGETLYERNGYQLRDSWERVFHPIPRERPGPYGLRLLKEAELLDHYSGLKAPPHDFCIWPSASQLDWHFAREAVYSKLLLQARPEFSGAALEDSAIGWIVDFKSGGLQILFLHAQSPARAAALLAEACHAAAALNLKEIRAWENEEFQEWNELPVPGSRRHLDGYLAMIRPLAAEADAKNWKLVSRATWI
jgi:hypothetical protein